MRFLAGLGASFRARLRLAKAAMAALSAAVRDGMPAASSAAASIPATSRGTGVRVFVSGGGSEVSLEVRVWAAT